MCRAQAHHDHTAGQEHEQEREQVPGWGSCRLHVGSCWLLRVLRELPTLHWPGGLWMWLLLLLLLPRRLLLRRCPVALRTVRSLGVRRAALMELSYKDSQVQKQNAGPHKPSPEASIMKTENCCSFRGVMPCTAGFQHALEDALQLVLAATYFVFL